MNYLYAFIFFILLSASSSIDSFAGRLKEITTLTVSQGTHGLYISIEWEAVTGSSDYSIWRANTKNGTFHKIADVQDTTEYNDTNIEPGYEYWYKVFPSSVRFSRYKGPMAAGHSKIGAIKGYNFKSLMKKFKRSKPVITSSDEKKKREEHLSLLEKYYLNYFKLNVAYYFSDYFIKQGNLIVMTNFKNYSFLYETKEILIKHPANEYQIIFNTNKFFRLMKESGDLSLMERLLNNAIAFCIYKGEKKIQYKNGRIKYIPYYEAAGMITQYFKYDEKWKNHTIIFGTSRKELKEKIKKVRKSKNI